MNYQDPANAVLREAEAELMGDEVAAAGWPEPLAPEAFHGLAGEIVRAIEPHSEADPAALLIQLLVAFGSCVGRAPHFVAESDRHGCNLYTVLVGDTSKGRKGTSLGHVKRLFGEIDEEWTADRVKTGLASGEGLIWHVRDEIKEAQQAKNGTLQVVTTDPGIADKRLLVTEPEFGRVLQVCERQSNTLSALIRQAWDGERLATLTKTKAAQATDPHISIIGHVTAGELRRLLSDTQASNGFANRFLWICVRRSKLLPEGGGAPDTAQFLQRLRGAVDYARKAHCLRRDAIARKIWSKVYETLSAGRPGLLGSLTSRSEAQTMRLAMLYALLNGSNEIQGPHLAAALAVWEYSERSAAFVWGDSLGDPAADTVLQALRAAGPGGRMTRTEISELFRRNKTAAEIQQALATLQRCGLATCAPRQSGGRPGETWVVVTK